MDGGSDGSARHHVRAVLARHHRPPNRRLSGVAGHGRMKKKVGRGWVAESHEVSIAAPCFRPQRSIRSARYAALDMQRFDLQCFGMHRNAARWLGVESVDFEAAPTKNSHADGRGAATWHENEREISTSGPGASRRSTARFCSRCVTTLRCLERSCSVSGRSRPAL